MRKLVGLAVLTAVVAAPAAAQMNGGETVEIPLRVYGGRMIVPVEASDGTQLEFIASTFRTFFSETGAKRAGARAGLTLGGIPVSTDEAQTVPDAELTFGGKVYDGVVGAETLNQFDVLFDVHGGRLVLQPTGRTVRWDGMTMSDPVPLRIFHGVAIGLDVELPGTQYQATLDLSKGSILVSQPVRRSLALEGDRTETFKLGDATFTDLPLQVLDVEAVQGWDPSGKGFVFVGAPIASDCAISVSWVHQELRTCVR